jgi:HlyD family secretion protein
MRMNRIKTLLLILAPLIVPVSMGLTSCSWFPQTSGNSLIVSGNIELTQVNISFKVPGKLVDLPLEEGMTIQKEQILARLDAIQIQRQREREQAGLVSAESMEPQLMMAIRLQKAQLAAEQEIRRAELEQAEARLQELLTGSRKQEVQQAQAALEEARSQHRQATQDWERAQVLHKNDDISTSQRDMYLARFQSTQAFVRQAEERLALVQEGARREQIDQARAQVERCKAAIKLTEAGQLEIQRKELELETRKAETSRARSMLAVIDSQLSDMTIHSPTNGVVLVKSAEVGEVIAAGTSVATVADLEKPWVRAYLSERNLGRVKIGDPVKVTTDSFPRKVYQGRISFISSQAEFTPKQIQTQEERVKLVYRIKIEVDNPQQELKLNMPADAEIMLH